MDKANIRKQTHSAKKLRNTIISSLLSVIVVIIIICAGTYKYHHTFTIDKWNNNIEKRIKIVDDLLDKYQLIGMNESRIIELLGEENSDQSSFKISKEYFPPDTTMVYYLGVDYIDNCWLIISFNDGVVSRYCIDVS